MTLTAQTAHRQVWRPLWELPRRADLIFSFAKRDLLGRYKGSALGIAWAVLTPVVMIAIFTFIFAGVFGARFGDLLDGRELESRDGDGEAPHHRLDGLKVSA